MSFEIIQRLPDLLMLKKEVPLPEEDYLKVMSSRIQLRRIFHGDDPRKVLIVGPCSAWPSDAVVEYAGRLAPLAERYKDRLLIVMRSYLQKPRTVTGWQGPLIQPDPFGQPDMVAGVYTCRQMMVKIIQQGLPIADETLFPRKEGYFRDLLSYTAIGARSSENQEHRILASMLEIPVGLKNPTSGSLKVGINSVLAAQQPNVIGLTGYQMATSGNSTAHLVLRGGAGKPNYGSAELTKATEQMAERGVVNPAIVVDLSHENSYNAEGVKDPSRQPVVLWDTINTMRGNPQVAETVKGWMMESFLKTGKQNLKTLSDMSAVETGVSVTDSCLGWEETAELITELYTELAFLD